MDFTREPIIETIITPKEGSKLVVRSSKGVSQEEYFVDAIQVVSYGTAFFFRSLEKPKAFLVPVSDYEILEVREARMVLKNVGVERTIKIGGGREPTSRPAREPQERVITPSAEEMVKPVATLPAEGRAERTDKKRDRRRQGRRRRGRDERVADSVSTDVAEATEESMEAQILAVQQRREVPSTLTAILPPPSQLISETLQQYRGNDLFKDIFSRPIERSPLMEDPFVPEAGSEQETQQG